MQELEKLIMARCTVIQIVTHEERRAVEYIKEVCHRLSQPGMDGKARTMDLKLWSVSRGLYGYGDEKNPTAMDPTKLVQTVASHEGDCIFVAFDFHPYMGSSPSMIRMLRETAFTLKVNTKFRRALVLVQPTKVLPTEIEKELAVIDLPMPSYDVLKDRLDLVIKTLNRDRDKKIILNDVDHDRIVRSGQGLIRDEFDSALAMCNVEHGVIDARAVQKVTQYKKEIVKKGGLLEYIDTDINMDDVGGLQNLKSWLERRAGAFSTDAVKFGLPSPRGLLIIGTPGCVCEDTKIKVRKIREEGHHTIIKE